MASGQGINVGGIYADLEIDSGKLDRGLAKARSALDAIAKEIKQLDQDFKSGAIGLGSYTDRMTALSTTQSELTTRMMAAYSATRTLSTGLELVTKNANGMLHATNRMGQGLMQLGYIADDIQYGFSGIVNNIAPLVYGLGGSGGLATAAQIAAVGIYQLYVHWDQFTDLLGVSPVRTEAEDMEILAKATSRTADEQDRLNKYKEKQADIAKMLAGQSKEQVTTEKAVQDIYNEADPNKIAGTLAASMKPAGFTEAQLKKAAELQQDIALEITATGKDSPDTAEAVKKFRDYEAEVEKVRDKEGVERAKQLMLDAKKAGPEGDQARRSIMNKLGDPNNPLYGVAMQLQDAGPEGIAKSNAAAAQAEAKTENEKNEKERKEAAKKIDKEKQAKFEVDRKKELGPIAYLEEKQAYMETSAGEDAELIRLKEAAADKKFREDKQEREANEKEAREIAPGIGKMGDVLALQTMTGAITPDQAREAIAKQLGRQGVDATKTVQAADMIFEESEKDVREGIAKRMVDGKGDRQKTSQVFDANSLAANFQGSVGGAQDEAKKTNSLLEKLEKQVDQIARARGWDFRGRR